MIKGLKIIPVRPVRRVLMLFLAVPLVYFYLYTVGGIKTKEIYRVVKGDLEAIWNKDSGIILNHIKAMQEDSEYIKNIAVSRDSSLSVFPALTHLPVPILPAKDQGISRTMLLDTLKENIVRNEKEPLLTLFTTWNDNKDKYLVHNLTVKNWLSMRPYIIPVIFTNESGLAKECERQDWNVFPVKVESAGGIPVLKYMYKKVMEIYNTTFYAYSNSDILFTDTLIHTLLSLKNSSIHLEGTVMIVGKRTNVQYVTEIEGSSWTSLTSVAKTRGNLSFGNAEDYFITPRTYPWDNIAEVVIGRPAYDNWLVYNARKQKHMIIDATDTLLAVHQTTGAGNMEGHGHKNKDYNHKLLVKTYTYKNIKNYHLSGITDCVEHYTSYEHGSVVIANRTNHSKRCFI